MTECSCGRGWEVPVVGVEDQLQVRRVGGDVCQDAQELEVQSLAQMAKIVKGVGLHVGGLAALRVLIHVVDDVEMGRVLEVLYDEGVGVDIVDDVCQWPHCGSTSLHLEGLQARQNV